MKCPNCGHIDVRLFEHIEQHREVIVSDETSITVGPPIAEQPHRVFLSCTRCGWHRNEDKIGKEIFFMVEEDI